MLQSDIVCDYMTLRACLLVVHLIYSCGFDAVSVSKTETTTNVLKTALVLACDGTEFS